MLVFCLKFRAAAKKGKKKVAGSTEENQDQQSKLSGDEADGESEGAPNQEVEMEEKKPKVKSAATPKKPKPNK